MVFDVSEGAESIQEIHVRVIGCSQVAHNRRFHEAAGAPPSVGRPCALSVEGRSLPAARVGLQAEILQRAAVGA